MDQGFYSKLQASRDSSSLTKKRRLFHLKVVYFTLKS